LDRRLDLTRLAFNFGLFAWSERASSSFRLHHREGAVDNLFVFIVVFSAFAVPG
jgi:hypothetical protein